METVSILSLFKLLLEHNYCKYNTKYNSTCAVFQIIIITLTLGTILYMIQSYIFLFSEWFLIYCKIIYV